MTYYLAAIALPFIGGLHRYAVTYGYRGASRREAWGEAWRVTVVLAVISASMTAVHISN